MKTKKWTMNEEGRQGTRVPKHGAVWWNLPRKDFDDIGGPTQERRHQSGGQMRGQSVRRKQDWDLRSTATEEHALRRRTHACQAEPASQLVRKR